MATVKKVNLADKFALFSEHWSPKVVGELNGQEVKLAKLQGEFIWHRHDEADELFLVYKGSIKIELRDETVTLAEGEFFIVPRGIEHKPVADNEAEVLLFEPKSTLNTGQHKSERTIVNPEVI
ncbi:MAG: cupin domain-containing protein [Candidatus Marinimicrobia bacterium]|nr:cupin domain-containing protein [Candidatus Neomarinimicrobiota bacterium]